MFSLTKQTCFYFQVNYYSTKVIKVLNECCIMVMYLHITSRKKINFTGVVCFSDNKNAKLEPEQWYQIQSLLCLVTILITMIATPFQRTRENSNLLRIWKKLNAKNFRDFVLKIIVWKRKEKTGNSVEIK